MIVLSYFSPYTPSAMKMRFKRIPCVVNYIMSMPAWQHYKLLFHIVGAIIYREFMVKLVTGKSNVSCLRKGVIKSFCLTLKGSSKPCPSRKKNISIRRIDEDPNAKSK